MSTPLIAVEDLRVDFGAAEVVRGIDLTVHPGECVAVVGESGSGKSVTARSLVGLAGPRSRVRAAKFEVDGRDASRFAERDWRRIRGAFAGLVLQDALGSLDPLRRVGDEIGEVLGTHRIGDRRDRAARIRGLLDDVHVPEPERRARQYPHELSGGLRQRALIASAVAGGPRLLIADEPTTALDVTVQAQILRLLDEKRAAGAALLLISHDLSVVARLADRILVLKDGVVVEQGTPGEVLGDPRDAYTRRLIAAVPSAATRGLRLSVDAQPVPAHTPDPATPVITAAGLSKRYGQHEVVRDVSFTIGRGETLGLVGESGSGKSTVAAILFGTVAPDAGTVTFAGRDWAGVRERDRRPDRRGLQFIAQDPLASFDPRYTVERIVAEAVPPGEPVRERVRELLDRVGLPSSVRDRRPVTLSGGQRQRVAIARALAPRPALVICDEPVSALDVSVQAQVLDLLADLRAADGTALLFISHDLGVVHHLADRVLVLHEGAVVEQGPVHDVFTAPRHAYTKELLAAVPSWAKAPALEEVPS
ncbi:nickel ABC transporter ATP-binding protein NikE [Hamadaea tsunoensis]|uniref:nickel ABC transporter ATP-binding protein NikE n=1 Tax=Hamadaea tsunoensis TaxID=53368 RepID=UPI0005505DDA|nr:ABC transporter ATP-binding protein [Hamadaea tsunoensis]